MGILESIATPSDLRRLNDEQLATLATEIRDFLVQTCSRTGGHLGPNLGVVELTIALHRVFDSPHDAIVFDDPNREVSGKFTYIEYARFADDLVILIDAYKRHDWLVGAVDKRLREEFGKLQVEINDEKSRTVDLERGECFGFLGFEFRYLRGLSGAMRPHYTPKLKKRTALLRTLKQIFRSHRSRPISEVIAKINPILRGWVQYFAVGHSSRCFSYIRDWVEKKIRHHLVRASQRHGFGWKRWSKAWLYGTLGLFAEYRVAR